MFEAVANWPVVRVGNLIALIDEDKVNFASLIEKTAAQPNACVEAAGKATSSGNLVPQEQCRISRILNNAGL